MPERRKVCVILVDRANYGRLRPVMRAIDAHPGLELQTVVAGTMVLERFQHSAREVSDDGFRVDGQVYMELEGSLPLTMAKSIGIGIVEFANVLHRLAPEVVLVIGDRYEALAATTAAAYMNFCVVHVQGGEVSGSIDESARHAMTKLAHYHYPSTERAAEYLRRMGEPDASILGIGCPSGDLVAELTGSLEPSVLHNTGSGALIDAERPFLLVVFHPVTTQFGDEREQIEELLAALNELAVPTVLLWPNIDAGADHISKAIRIFRDQHHPAWLRLLTNLAPDDYLSVLESAACAVGNSSSFVRDASFVGTPVVLVGVRQQERETGEHVRRVPAERRAIESGVRAQLDHGRYAPIDLYGNRNVGPAMAEAIAGLRLFTQKQLDYPARDRAVPS